MTGRRSSARIAAKSSQESSSPPQPKPSPANNKRKNESSGSSPSAKRGKKGAEPEQKTLEETLQNGGSGDTDKDQPAPTNAEQHTSQDPAPEGEKEPAKDEVENSATEPKQEDEKPQAEQDAKMTDAGDEQKEDSTEKKDEAQPTTSEPKQDEKPADTNGDAVEAGAREDDVPSSILEKGVIYFFFRARVNVEDPQDVNDVARTYIVLRPIPLDAKIGDGPIGDEGNCRLLALPKKVLPVSGRDRFLAFVEKAKTSFSDLKDSFLKGSEYETKTAGTSHSPPVTPLAEGVYAITSTGRESHLAYIINIPSELGEVQKDLGLQERGSFVASVKNPTQPAPGNASLPKGPEYPQEILDEFRNLRWKPLEPKYLDYNNAQFLLIGESHHLDKALEQRPKDEREGNVAPEEEMEKLEGEDEIRIKHLKGDDSVFVDLGVTAKDFPKVPTTW